MLTNEVRWFFGNEKSVKDWFMKRYPTHVDLQHRVDTYYPISGRPDWGLKYREGEYELKCLTGIKNELRLAKTVAGRPEVWEKWTIPLHEKREWEKEIAANGLHPLHMEKTRWVSKIKINEGKVAGLYKYDVELEKGCQIEYTELKWGIHTFFTYGIEVFGGEHFDGIRDFLAAMLEGQDLEVENSFGYPHFIENALKNT